VNRAALATAMAALAACLLQAGEKLEYGRGRRLCVLKSKRVDESSGIAASRTNPGVLWTHNDSGDQPRLYAFDAKGTDIATVEVHGAINRDWEDMASFSLGGKGWLLVADVGDNSFDRDNGTLYLVPEPRLDLDKPGARIKTRATMAIDVRYEGGPQNCEAVAVDPTSRLVVLVTKAVAFECSAYALPLPKKVGRDEVLVARRIARLKLPVVTGMDISPDGLRAVVLTYGHAYEFIRRAHEKWADALKRAPRTIKLPPRRQGEAVCYDAAGRSLFLTSEGRPCPLFFVPAMPAVKSSR